MVKSRSNSNSRRRRRRKMSSSHCGGGGCYSENSPQFFKLYVPHHSSQSLRIPPAFIKHLKGVLPSKSILKTPAKRSWRIDMNKVDNNFFFQKGWPEFVRDNSLMFGDFLIFCYTCNMEFYVTIFGKNNCQKEVPIATRDGDEPQPLLQRNQTVGPCKSEERMFVDSVEVGTSSMSIQTPSELASKNPVFKTVLKPTYVHYGYMYIPSGFVESYMSTHRQTARLMHLNKSWLVKLTRHRNRIVISCGWRKFVADNTLLEGDICRFELIQRDDYVFNVAILRGNWTPDKAHGTKIIQPSSSGEEGESEERMCVDSVEMGTTCMPVRDNIGALKTPSELGTKKPFFESVLKPTYVHAAYMRIPSKFQKHYINEPRETAKLQYSNKRWVVNLKTYKGIGLVFSGGWSKFVKQNSLQVGDVCSFELIEKENYVFTVSISRGKSKEIGVLHNREEGSKMTVEVAVGVAFEDPYDEFTSKHPFFHVVLSPTYVGQVLCIPAKFWKSFIDEPGPTARLQCSNKWWMVNLKDHGNSGYFSGGWSKFVKENSLQVGDACCFELIGRENYVFKVSIARRIDSSSQSKA